jgi:triosephosphate isomerase
MFHTKAETKAYFGSNLAALDAPDREIVFFVPFTDIDTAVSAVQGSHIQIGAQNAHYEPSGAYTGEISCAMIKETGAKYVLVGHSERRKYFAETDEAVNKKIAAVYACGLKPMVCVGESPAERQAGAYLETVGAQIGKALDGIAVDERLVIAYEPVWAIGTGV